MEDAMKELLLHARLDAGNSDIAPSAICEWLLELAGGLASDETPVSQKLFYSPSADTLEIWLKDTALQQTENIIRYSRLSFKVLLPQADAPSCSSQADAPSCSSQAEAPSCSSQADASSSLRLSLELLPPAQLYIGLPLSEMGLVGVSPRLVCVGARLQPLDTLSHEQMRLLRHTYAVLTPALSARLNLPLSPSAQSPTSQSASPQPAPPQSAPSQSAPPPPPTPYRHLLTETERLLRLAFPGGGHSSHCPLHLSLQPADVPACRLLQVPAEYRLLRFGGDNTEHCPRTGLSAYGPFLPARHHSIGITMLYPQGHLDDARRLFHLFTPLASLIAVQPVGDVNDWISYQPGPQAVGQLMEALLISSARRAPSARSASSSASAFSARSASAASAFSAAHIYCLITPSAADASLIAGLHLTTRFDRLLRRLGGRLLGPVPLHAISPRAFDHRLPTIACHLLRELGGVPCTPLHFPSQATDLIAGFTHSRPRQSSTPLCAFTLFDASSHRCPTHDCTAALHFNLYFSRLFAQAYDAFCQAHPSQKPRRLVVYCHHGLPIDPLAEFAAWQSRYPADAVPVVLVSVRRTTATNLRHYAPSSAGCMPPAGTCLRCGHDRYLLFCGHPASATSPSEARHPLPLEVVLKRLAPDGSLLSPPAEEVDGLLVQVCQLVWSNTEAPLGSPLPLVLSLTDRLMRRHCSEQQLTPPCHHHPDSDTGEVAF